MAYIHSHCSDNELVYIKSDSDNLQSLDIKTMLKEIDDPTIALLHKKESKYKKLFDYFAKCTSHTFKITFKEIEQILEYNLCNSALKYQSYWYTKSKGSFANCWLENGYKIKTLYLDRKYVVFVRQKKQSSSITIPKQILASNIPKSAKYELEQFFDYIIAKYGL